MSTFTYQEQNITNTSSYASLEADVLKNTEDISTNADRIEDLIEITTDHEERIFFLERDTLGIRHDNTIDETSITNNVKITKELVVKDINITDTIEDIQDVTTIFTPDSPTIGTTTVETNLDMGYLTLTGVGQVDLRAAGQSGRVYQYINPGANNECLFVNTLANGSTQSSFFSFYTRNITTTALKFFRIFDDTVHFGTRSITNCPTIDTINTNIASAVSVNNTQTSNIAINAANIATNTANISTNTTNIATNTAAIASVVSVNNTQTTNIAANTKIASAFYRFVSGSTDMRFNGITNFDANGAEIEGVSRLVLDPVSGGSGQGMIHNVTAQDLRIHANNFHAGGSGIVFRTMQNLTSTSKDARLSYADFQLNGRTLTGCTNLDALQTDVDTLQTEVATISDNLGNYNQSILIADDFAAGYISLQKTQNGAGGGPEWSNRSTNSSYASDRAETQDSIPGHPGIVRLYITSSINDDTAVLLGLRRLPCAWGDVEKVEIIYMVPNGLSQYNFTVEIGFGESKDLNTSAIVRCQNNDNYTFEINRGAPSATSAVAGIRKDKWMLLTITNTGSGNCLFHLKNLTDNTSESYNYTGGTISMTELVTPWVGLRNRSGTTPSAHRWMFVDYVGMRYKCSSRA